MLVGTGHDRALRDDRVPVAGTFLPLEIGPFVGLAHQVDLVPADILFLAFMARIDDVVEMTPPDDPAIGVVDRRDPAREGGTKRKLFLLSIDKAGAELRD